MRDEPPRLINGRVCPVAGSSSVFTAITPFFSIQERSKLNFKKYKDLLPENNRTLEVIPQLIGNNPHHFLDTVEKLAEKTPKICPIFIGKY